MKKVQLFTMGLMVFGLALTSCGNVDSKTKANPVAKTAQVETATNEDKYPEYSLKCHISECSPDEKVEHEISDIAVKNQILDMYNTVISAQENIEVSDPEGIDGGKYPVLTIDDGNGTVTTVLLYCSAPAPADKPTTVELPTYDDNEEVRIVNRTPEMLCVINNDKDKSIGYYCYTESYAEFYNLVNETALLADNCEISTNDGCINDTESPAEDIQSSEIAVEVDDEYPDYSLKCHISECSLDEKVEHEISDIAVKNQILDMYNEVIKKADRMEFGRAEGRISGGEYPVLTIEKGDGLTVSVCLYAFKSAEEGTDRFYNGDPDKKHPPEIAVFTQPKEDDGWYGYYCYTESYEEFYNLVNETALLADNYEISTNDGCKNE